MGGGCCVTHALHAHLMSNEVDASTRHKQKKTNQEKFRVRFFFSFFFPDILFDIFTNEKGSISLGMEEACGSAEWAYNYPLCVFEIYYFTL